MDIVVRGSFSLWNIPLDGQAFGVVVIGGQSLGPPWVKSFRSSEQTAKCSLCPVLPQERARDHGAIPGLSTEHLLSPRYHAVNTENSSFFMCGWTEAGFSQGVT